MKIIPLPHGLQDNLCAAAISALKPPKGGETNFTHPLGEDALVCPNSVSWRIFKNPIALLIGGIAAVILELAEPAVRAGVWGHSCFRTDPMRRLRRTGMAAMVTVYGARSVAEPMIARVVRMHAGVTGQTAAGVPYSANDPRLLKWVHATASFSFTEAYSRFVQPLSVAECNALYLEAVPVSRLYGVIDPPTTDIELKELFDSMASRLEPSPIIFEFLQIMRDAPALPKRLRWMQRMLVRAAVDVIPGPLRQRLGLTATYGLGPGQRLVMRMAGAVANKIVLPVSPASQACLRLGLPATFLYQ